MQTDALAGRSSTATVCRDVVIRITECRMHRYCDHRSHRVAVWVVGSLGIGSLGIGSLGIGSLGIGSVCVCVLGRGGGGGGGKGQAFNTISKHQQHRDNRQ